VAFKCEGCEEVLAGSKEFKHKDDCKKKSVKKSCTKSGTPPHAPLPKK
jgi:hypothetical protein